MRALTVFVFGLVVDAPDDALAASTKLVLDLGVGIASSSENRNVLTLVVGLARNLANQTRHTQMSRHHK